MLGPRKHYVGILPIALALLFFFSLCFSQQINPITTNTQQTNLSIANAISYVNAVNENAYLVFYPNLTAANSDLSSASTFSSSPAVAMIYVNMALESASAENTRINSYRQISLPIMIAFTAAMAALLYMLMKPVKIKKMPKKKKQQHSK